MKTNALWADILIQALSNATIKVYIDHIESGYPNVIETRSYTTLKKIKAAMEDGSLSDFDCIERIMELFDAIGSPVANRHDFG